MRAARTLSVAGAMILAGVSNLTAAEAAVSGAPSGSLPAASPSAMPSPPPFAIDSAIEGPVSPYTQPLIDLVKRWPPADLAAVTQADVKDNPVHLVCYDTPGNSTYVGVRQVLFIKAPLASVAGVMDDIDHYKELFPGYDDVHVVSRERNRIFTYWEQHIPIFFIPNAVVELTYLVDSSRSDRKVYRYQVKSSKSVRLEDGIVVLESRGPGLTRYVEYDFFDADWGLVKSLGDEKVWTESLNGIYLSDVAIQYKAEQPQLSYEEIRERSKKTLDRFPAIECWKKRRKFSP